MKRFLHSSIGIICNFLFASVVCEAQTSHVQEIINIIKNRKAHPHYYLVAAHRGYWSDYPENSQGAYEMAIELGVDIVEMDVRVTKDGQMVIFHDACLDRVTTGYGRLRDTNWSDIQNLYLIMPDGSKTQSKMLTLDEALNYLKDKAVVSIDIKETGALFNTVFVKIIKLLKSKGMLWQSIIKGKMPLADLQLQLAKAGTTFTKLENNTYMIQNVGSSRFVHPIGHSTVDGTRLQQLDYTTGYAPYFKWIIAPDSEANTYRIYSVADPNMLIHLSGHKAEESNEVEILLYNATYPWTYDWIMQ